MVRAYLSISDMSNVYFEEALRIRAAGLHLRRPWPEAVEEIWKDANTDFREIGLQLL